MSGDLSGKMKDLNIFVRKEKPCIPSENSPADRTQTFHGQLFSEIKKKLWSGRREDPEISIDLNIDKDVFMEGLGLKCFVWHYPKRKNGLPNKVK